MFQILTAYDMMKHDMPLALKKENNIFNLMF